MYHGLSGAWWRRMVAVVTVSLRELLAEASLASRRAGHIIGRVCIDAERKWSQIVVAAEIEMHWPAGIETLSYRIQSLGAAGRAVTSPPVRRRRRRLRTPASCRPLGDHQNENEALITKQKEISH
ncbi:hypothetical protein Q7P36_009808 [Cladosporium allicinum]